MAAVRPSSGEKGVERCQISYIEGVEPSKQTSLDESSETHLVVKLNCKHGLYISRLAPICSRSSACQA